MWRSPQALRSSKGFSLIEVIAALAILSVAIVALIELYSASLRTTGKSYMHTVGTVYARSMMEEALSGTDMDSLLEVDVELGDGFKGSRSAEVVPEEELALSPITSEEGTETELIPMSAGTTYLITVTVSWPPSGGTTLRAYKTVYEADDAEARDSD